MKMRRLIPIKNSVVCKKINKTDGTEVKNGVHLHMKDVDLYEVIDFSDDKDNPFEFKVGDIVMSNSTGDEIEVNRNDIYYLFKNEHIMCKVEDYV